ncbi:acetate/propionate family kinase [Rhodanobacter sp. C05]|uniref:acetate/propionate family kinase n=1 Tax=Rhodanobacter sp. C05 TaxID=1945855 RepID=UPI0009844E32|nr:acetate/propionate family kinase [Rhodanobacter sp. C05]OOG38581.1 acetate kinase [Rhodanobacter sp. C05]
MPKAILTLNAGSSSIKFALYELDAGVALQQVSHGQIESIGVAPHFIARATDGTVLSEYRWTSSATLEHEALLTPLLAWITTHLGQEALCAVGHRIVHGGSTYNRPVYLDAQVVADLTKLTPLAPLHQPHNLAAVRAIAQLRPELPQVGCFDTAFHHGLSADAARLALPRRYAAEGVRRYGFHGLSYEYIAGRLREQAPGLAAGRVIAAHLGNGASLCAMHNGQSVDTTMGFTTLDGLVMGTRCGNLDPGAVLYLQQAHGLSATDVEHMLYHDSGLLGVSGISSDMRMLLTSDDACAREAIDLFVFRIARETGALISTLGGIDALVFSAGIGEHAAPIRAAVCARLGWLGIECDAEANSRHAAQISTSNSRVPVFIVPTDEEAMIASHTAHVLQNARSPV